MTEGCPLYQSIRVIAGAFTSVELVLCGVGRVEGMVWDTGAPGSGHVVRLVQRGASIATTTADASGAYAFDGVAVGTYSVDVVSGSCADYSSPSTFDVTHGGIATVRSSVACGI